jgi:rSAM/selenodomain-associated transferase 1
MARRLVCIMAKPPVAGQAKTRLIPVLGAHEAALLQQHMLLDTIELVSAALEGDGSITIVCPAAGDRAALRRVVPASVGVVAHERLDLMSGLDYALTHHIDHGYEQVVLLDGDSPTLPAHYIRMAFDHLKEDAVVLGPTLDGGYYLIGACQQRSALFDWPHLDSATICQQTRARAEALGSRVHMLPPWYDVDTAEDLERLSAELHRYPSHAPHTFRFLERDGRR